MFASYAAQIGQKLFEDYGLKAEEIDSQWLSDQINKAWLANWDVATATFQIANKRQSKA